MTDQHLGTLRVNGVDLEPLVELRRANPDVPRIVLGLTGSRHHGAQCGSRAPGFLTLAEAYPATCPDSDGEEVRHVVLADLLRCTGSQRFMDAAWDVARARREQTRG